MPHQEFGGEQAFYAACADLLGAEHVYRRFPFRRKTRWNNRLAGNGRFPGFGLIRLFGSHVHVHLRAPVAVNRWFESRESALSFLAELPAPHTSLASAA
jgi:hypothetical protein